MKTILTVILQTQTSQLDQIKGGVVLILVCMAIVYWFRKVIKNKSSNQSTVAYSSTLSNTPNPVNTQQQENNVEDEHDSRFEEAVKSLSAEEWDISHEDINIIVTTSQGTYSILNDDEVYVDDKHVITMDNSDSYFVTPEGEFYFNDTDECVWKKLGDKDTFSWVDYVKLASDDDQHQHPEGEIDSEDMQVLLNEKVLYSGSYNTYTQHPNFGVIVADEWRVFINKHLNYEGYFDELYPDPEGLVVQVDDDYYLIPKNIPTPDLLAVFSEKEYQKIISNSDSEFVKKRITDVYSGRVLQQDFDGEVWVSEKGLLFVPSGKQGTLYLRDAMVHSSDGCVTNVVIDAENIFVEVDDHLWYRNGSVFFDSNSEYVNYFGVTEEKDKEWETEIWPNGTIVRSKGELIQKNGNSFLEALWVAWYMHPKGIVIVDEEEKMYLFSF